MISVMRLYVTEKHVLLFLKVYEVKFKIHNVIKQQQSKQKYTQPSLKTVPPSSRITFFSQLEAHHYLKCSINIAKQPELYLGLSLWKKIYKIADAPF